MSNGENLLNLQEIDMELARLKGELAELPELVSLAKKRRALATAKTELRNIKAQRKDVETDLEDLDIEEEDYRSRLNEVQKSMEGESDYHAVQDFEIQLTNIAKWLDKVDFDRKECHVQLEALLARENEGETYIKRLEASILKSAEAARVAATNIQQAIADNEEKRARLVASLPEDLKAAYDRAAKQFRGLGVEQLKGSVPSICHMMLTEASLDEVRSTHGVTTCPYCHRILVLDEVDA